MSRVLAIDYGEKYIGLAMGDTEEYYIVPYEVLSTGSFEDLYIELEKIVNESKIDEIVVGYPLGMNGEKTDQTLEVEKFADALQAKVGLPLIFEDERLTSKMAEKQQQGFLKKIWSGTNKNQVQKSSAILILETYLDKKKNQKG